MVRNGNITSLDEEFDEINEEAIVSAGGGEGELQEQEEGTAD